MKRIGIDVGGTNTDAVLIENDKVVKAAKIPTTPDVMSGVVSAIQAVINSQATQHCQQSAKIDAVMIGTTHFTNAVVERTKLERIAALRIASPATSPLQPGSDWPSDIYRAVDPMVFMIEGGHEYDGRPLVPIDRDAIRDAARKILDSGIKSIAITALFSPLTAECENEAAEIICSVMPDAKITLSHTLGRIGLLERENVTMLNAALQGLGTKVVDAFGKALQAAGVKSPVYLTQNDGTVVTAEVAAQYPVYSFASGPTNSMRGAAFLTGLPNAMVADVGGTTTDIGCLVNGFPREANSTVEVGGVRTLFRMPDLLPIGIGGGSIVQPQNGVIGPKSVGFRISEKALVFGGSTLTATDLAVAMGRVNIGDKSLVKNLDGSMVSALLKQMEERIEVSIDRMKTSGADVELVAVGGGAFLIPDTLSGIKKVHRVEHAGVANAIGAAMAQISGEVDQVFGGMSRDAALSEAKELAISRACDAGAVPETIKTVEVEDIPIAYLPGNSRRVRFRVAGDLAESGPRT